MKHKSTTTLQPKPLLSVWLFPAYTSILYVYSLMPQSLKNLTPYLWALPGIYCLNFNRPRNGRFVHSHNFFWFHYILKVMNHFYNQISNFKNPITFRSMLVIGKMSKSDNQLKSISRHEIFCFCYAIFI
jgi:hypothetical protein